MSTRQGFFSASIGIALNAPANHARGSSDGEDVAHHNARIDRARAPRSLALWPRPAPCRPRWVAIGESADVELSDQETFSSDEEGAEVNLFVKSGKLALPAEIVLGALVLLGFFGIPLLDMPLWLAIPIGVVAVISAALLIFEGAAASIGLRPFANDPLGWRKAKKTYEAPDDIEKSQGR